MEGTRLAAPPPEDAGRKRRRSSHPKGRQVDPAARAEVERLIDGIERRRDLLIEHLHAINDALRCLPKRHLTALADLLRLAPVEVYEVATFYHHFHVVEDGAPLPETPVLRICDSLSCMLRGADELVAWAEKTLGDHVRVERAPCMGLCDKAPAAILGRNPIPGATREGLANAAAERADAPSLPPYRTLETYRADGGYRLLETCRSGARTPDQIMKTLEDANLRGLGGAGFPTGRKWRIVSNYPGPRLMAINADEGEPGTIKDRFYLERDPHRMLEGMLIAMWAVGIETCYIYLRDEYPDLHDVLRTELDALRAAGLLDGLTVELRRGAGAYICGEESAMIESIEGNRGLPRNRPPYVAEKGLFDRPTLVNNVETLYWIRDIVERGPDWFASHGRNGRKGLRSFSVSGHVKNPGVKLAPAGISIRELIDEFCGGMEDGHAFKAFLPGGASGGILSAEKHGDVPLDFGTIEEHGGFIGSAAVVVLSDKDDLKAAALNLTTFFAHESCGQCTPCRVGTEKATTLLSQPQWDVDLLNDLSAVMRDGSICGLGQAAPNVWLTLLRHFPEEIR